MLKVFLVLILIFNVYLNGKYCLLPIMPNEGDIIICDNACINCNIICNTINQCFRIKIYSSALNTTIQCNGENSCFESKIYIGNTGYYPNNYNESNFKRNNFDTINIDCSNKLGCTKSRIIINGNFTNNLTLNADAYEQDSFKDSSLNVTIYDNSYFNLNCGQSRANCDGTKYLCRSGSCLCNGNIYGNTQGCVGLSNGIISPTPSPTLIPTTFPTDTSQTPTLSPTILTISPSITPTETPTDSPTIEPTFYPTKLPSKVTQYPINSPTINPSILPTLTPSVFPTNSPSLNPTHTPSISPSLLPINIPSNMTTTNFIYFPTNISLIPIDNTIILKQILSNQQNTVLIKSIIIILTFFFGFLCTFIGLYILYNKIKQNIRESNEDLRGLGSSMPKPVYQLPSNTGRKHTKTIPSIVLPKSLQSSMDISNVEIIYRDN